jgi:hypothetical protein
MEKRGQVTIFIVIGIVIVAVIGLFWAFRSGFIDVYLSSSRDRVNVPDEISPVQSYLEGCLEDYVREGIKYMGMQGGYLDLDVYNPSAADRFTNTLTVYPGYRVAYWYYEGIGQEDRSQVPSKSLMEEQLGEFLKIGFGLCLDGLEDFREEGFDIKVKDIIKPDVKIEDNFIDVVVRAPVEIEKNFVSVKIPRHVVKVESSFGRLYEKAKELFENENEGFWLENATMNYLALYKDELPSYDVEFTCRSLVWKKSEIAESYKKILELNVPFYMVRGSEFDNYYKGDPLLTWDVGHDFSDISVIFDYDERWPFELDIQGSFGDAVISQPLSSSIPVLGLCVNTYNFVYTIKHPILITLRNTESDEEFSFATQVVIRNNKPRRKVEIQEGIDYCDIKDESVSVVVDTFDENGYSVPVEGVDLFYSCMNKRCYLGSTDEEGSFNGGIPVCLGGKLEAIKEGYRETEVSYDSFGGIGHASLYVEKLVPMNYRFMVYDLQGDSLIGPRELNENEEVVFEIRSLDDNKYTRIGFYPDESNIELSAGRYKLVAKLINNGPAHIQEKEIERCKCPELPLAGCVCGTETINLEAFDIEDVVVGGAEVSFSVERNDLGREIVFYVINGGLPITYDDLMAVYDSAGISSGYEDNLKPIFVENA